MNIKYSFFVFSGLALILLNSFSPAKAQTVTPPVVNAPIAEPNAVETQRQIDFIMKDVHQDVSRPNVRPTTVQEATALRDEHIASQTTAQQINRILQDVPVGAQRPNQVPTTVDEAVQLRDSYRASQTTAQQVDKILQGVPVGAQRPNQMPTTVEEAIELRDSYRASLDEATQIRNIMDDIGGAARPNQMPLTVEEASAIREAYYRDQRTAAQVNDILRDVPVGAERPNATRLSVQDATRIRDSYRASQTKTTGNDPKQPSNQSDNGGGQESKTLGNLISNIVAYTKGLPGLFTGAAYMFGLLLGLQGILKLKEHVESPNQHPAWDGVKRLLGGGAFFAFPLMVSATLNTIHGMEGANFSTGGFAGKASQGGLDAMIVNLMSNILAPSMWVVGWFGYLAGLIFVFIGISRLMKSEQEGARGPTGIGTVMTFIIAGCLFSLHSIAGYLLTTVFDNSKLSTNGALQYTQGLGGASEHIHAVISAIIAFSLLIGWISLVRGLFIVRGVSEGNSQASMMAAVTHLVGGVLAMNLGSVINAVQKTLGITQYGITFN